MAYRFRRFREISRVLSSHLHSDTTSRRMLSDISATPLQHLWARTEDRNVERRDHVRRCSMLSETHDLVPQTEILTFIKSTFNVLEGPNYQWLNYMDENMESFNRNGIFLVLVNAFIEDSTLLGHRERIIMLERAKLIQQRYPKLHIFGIQCRSSANSISIQTRIVQTIMEEYITFPILMLDKDITEMTNGACYLLFEGFRDRLFHHKLDVELGTIIQAIEEFDALKNGNVTMVQKSKGDRARQTEVIKEPYICSSFRNLLLYHAGCISVDEDGNRLFLSDSNHHRVIIADCDGKILDCIGSSPGFEDGQFESAKLLRPASSFYHIAENCLYFVDSENHAIRKADMGRRVLETVYPIGFRKSSGILSWILDKLGIAREVDLKPEEFDLDSLIFPWHLMMLRENELLIINRSFETSWIMSKTTGEIKEVLRGFPNIMEICGQMIMEKLSPLKEIYGSRLSQRLDHCLSLEGIPYAGLLSSLANFQKSTVFCDTAGQRVLKYHRESRGVSYIQFSDFGVLGLPYWLACPLERVFNHGDLYRQWNANLHYSSVLPGNCDIRVNVDIPKGTELAAPLDEDCIWRQVRGSAAEVSGLEGVPTCAEKVGVAQQWFDELDNLAFSNPGMESGLQDEDKIIDKSFQDKDKVHFDCAVKISPGTSEVVISGVVYLKLKRAQVIREDQKSNVMRILDFQNHDRKPGEDACIKLLLESCGDVRDAIFTKPLHLRIRLDCRDHPPAETPNRIISTDSTLEVNVSLD